VKSLTTADHGFVLGYDPGGNHAHGLAVLEIAREGGLWAVHGLAMAADCANVHEVIRRAEACVGQSPLLASGIDTLTAWCGGPAGWRAADLWLRKTYPQVQASVASPNSIYGSMSVGGGLLQWTHDLHAVALAAESHPFGRTRYWWPES
jgi:hypothetical protein